MKKRKGFTLLEVIVATVIIGILAAGIFATIFYSKRMSIRAQEKAIAVSLIEKVMSELKHIGAEELDATPTAELTDPEAPCNSPAAEAKPWEGCVVKEFGGKMNGVLTVDIKEASEGETAKNVKVSVTWTDRSLNVPRTESAVTYLGGLRSE